jgi:aminobenzoyl-glutamate transport protein
LVRLLQGVERAGNRLPDPVTLFVLACAAVVVLSVVFAGAEAMLRMRDGTEALRTVRSLATAEGFRWAMESAVTNFTGFAPLGKVLTVMLGIGVAERTGLIAASLHALVRTVPAALLTTTVVFAGVMSSMAADAGYVVLVPLGAVVFAGAGRHPLAGLFAAFAGVSSGFSANLLVTGLDPMLAGLTEEAARAVDPSYRVLATANWFFMMASTLMLALLGTLVSLRVVEPMLGAWQGVGAETADGEEAAADALTPAVRRRGLGAAGLAALAMGAAMVGLIVWPASPLRDAEQAAAGIMAELGPFFHALEVQIALLFLVPGLAFGVVTGGIRSDRDVARMMSDTMGSMGAYLVLAFVAAQFVAWFNWTHLGSVTAVQGAGLLREAGLGGLVLLVAFVLVSSATNLLIGSASAKWAFMAPIFVPMLMLTGLSPEAVQAAYRVGDSVTNGISPLLPYMPLILVFARRWDPQAGLGTVLAAMLPYSLTFLVGWVVLLGLFVGLDLPLGPGAPTWVPLP